MAGFGGAFMDPAGAIQGAGSSEDRRDGFFAVLDNPSMGSSFCNGVHGTVNSISVLGWACDEFQGSIELIAETSFGEMAFLGSGAGGCVDGLGFVPCDDLLPAPCDDPSTAFSEQMCGSIVVLLEPDPNDETQACEGNDYTWWVVANTVASSYVSGTLTASTDCDGSQALFTTELGVEGWSDYHQRNAFANFVIKASRLPDEGCTYRAAGECSGVWGESFPLTQDEYESGGVWGSVVHNPQAGGFEVYISVDGGPTVLAKFCAMGEATEVEFWAEGIDASRNYAAHTGFVTGLQVGNQTATSAIFHCVGQSKDKEFFGWNDVVTGGNLAAGRGTFDHDCSELQ